MINIIGQSCITLWVYTAETLGIKPAAAAASISGLLKTLTAVSTRVAVVLKNKVATKFSRSTWGNVSGFSPIFLPRAKDQSVRGKIMPVREITRNAVPQFLTSSGTVNVSLSTKIA